ncbi:MAG: carboxynorspermidine decarboxylase [Proteobacteria bacterium]|nr:carboxynorspermidine decarboxylase [Pseudomonadota bacterium]
MFDPGEVPTPCFVVDESLLKRNLDILDMVQKKAGCKILLAIKGFAMFHVFPLIRETLHGVCASSPHEAILGREEFGREVHACAAAFSESDMNELIPLCDHITFNSFHQWKRFKPLVTGSGRPIRFGIRVNPEHSETDTPIYDPCGYASRLGVSIDQFEADSLDGISGLLFHTLCEKNVDALERTLVVFEEKFGACLSRMEWVNFGGGHHITRTDYDTDRLINIIKDFRKKYNLAVYLEPGEAVALNTGFLVASVLDVIHNKMDIAILDTSAATHMPDVIEMPYRPHIVNSGNANEKPHTYRLGGPSCLAGDIIGDYSFDQPLKPGDKLVFTDMAHYSMVKTTTFNGIKLPSIALFRPDTDEFRVIREFGYPDYKSRLS